jgi:hypothetical protein
VDLHHYAAHLKDRAEAPAMDLGRMSFGRKPSPDLGAPMPASTTATHQSATTDPGDVDLEALTAFDVPAFLRREG